MNPEELRKAGLPLLAMNQAEWVYQQRARNAALSAQLDALADQYLRTGYGPNPSGVDDQGDAQVVEDVPALPAPEKGRGN